MIRRVSDSTTDAGVFYEVVPAQEDGRAGRSAVPFNMIKVTFAEDVESLPELEKLSREELIDLLMKTQGARREYPASNPLGQDPIIVYYKKTSDKIDIEKNIEGRGARAAIQMSKLDHVPTNALWFGVDVPVDEARRVAEALLREGVELKYFGPFLREGAKANRIEIGTDTGLGGDAVMTVETLRQRASELALERERG